MLIYEGLKLRQDWADCRGFDKKYFCRKYFVIRKLLGTRKRLNVRSWKNV